MALYNGSCKKEVDFKDRQVGDTQNKIEACFSCQTALSYPLLKDPHLQCECFFAIGEQARRTILKGKTSMHSTVTCTADHKQLLAQNCQTAVCRTNNLSYCPCPPAMSCCCCCHSICCCIWCCCCQYDAPGVAIMEPPGGTNCAAAWYCCCAWW